MNVTVGAKTDPGRRPNNEDQLAVVDVRRHRLRADGVLVIADGMGGRNFGERAAQAAVETVQDALVELLDADRTDGVNARDALDSALRKANACVYELAGQNEESKGMGTTCVAAVVDGDRLYVAHAGDSRAYLFRDNELYRLTDDHSYVAEQVRLGILTEENARRSRFRNVITRAVGIEPTIAPDLAEHDIQAGDLLLLCTDGLSNMVPEDEITQTLTQETSAQAAADRLVSLANRNGGRDNITAIVARLEVGNRTQRMRISDLARAAAPEPSDAHRNGNGSSPTDEASALAASAPEDETPTVVTPAQSPMQEPTPPEAPTADASPLVFSAPPSTDPPVPAAAPALWPQWVALVLAALCLLLLAVSMTLGHALTRARYALQLTPPFAVKPPPPPAPKPPNLAGIVYSAPVLLSDAPLQGGLLARDPVDGSLTVLTGSNQVLRVSAGGRVLGKYPLPAKYLPPAPAVLSPAAAVPFLPLSVDNLHVAADLQGNLYVADAALRTLAKYRPDGTSLGLVAKGQLTQPGALAVSTDGTVYLVDGQRLKAIPVQPSRK